MTFEVTHNGAYDVAVLEHKGPVDEEEIRASRLALKDMAREKNTRGVVIDITDSEINASPVDVIQNVEGLLSDLEPYQKLAFVARPESQDMVSLIVATVAHNSGFRVGQFHDPLTAYCWIFEDADGAKACGCLPNTEATQS